MRMPEKGEPDSSPFVNLVYAIYQQALTDLREFPVRSHECITAYKFLISDPYGVLPDDAIEHIKKEIKERRKALAAWKGGE